MKPAPINNIAIAILDGAQGDDLVTVKAKIDAANIFTSHLDLQLEIDAYRGNTAAQIGRDFITAVTKTDPGTTAKADAAILRLFRTRAKRLSAIQARAVALAAERRPRLRFTKAHRLPMTCRKP